MIEKILARVGNLRRLFEQADASLTRPSSSLICARVWPRAVPWSAWSCPACRSTSLLSWRRSSASLPLVWLLMRRRRRLKKFGQQLPDALEMLGRALRAGQSLAFGFNLVADEMAAPIGKEFGRCSKSRTSASRWKKPWTT